MPTVAWHPYADVKGMDERPAFNGTVNTTRLHVYRRAYYASISYTDYKVLLIKSEPQRAIGLAAHHDEVLELSGGESASTVSDLDEDVEVHSEIIISLNLTQSHLISPR